MFVHFSFGKLLEQEKLLVSKTKVVRRIRSNGVRDGGVC